MKHHMQSHAVSASRGRRGLCQTILYEVRPCIFAEVIDCEQAYDRKGRGLARLVARPMLDIQLDDVSKDGRGPSGTMKAISESAFSRAVRTRASCLSATKERARP